MGKQAERQKYIHDYARTLANKLGLRSRSFTNLPSPQSVAGFIMGGFEGRYWKRIEEAINSETDQTIGCLAMCARAPFRGVPTPGVFHWVSLPDIWGYDVMFIKEDTPDGETVTRKVAFAAVVAAMADNIWSDLKKRQREVNSCNSGAIGNPSF